MPQAALPVAGSGAAHPGPGVAVGAVLLHHPALRVEETLEREGSISVIPGHCQYVMIPYLKYRNCNRPSEITLTM